MLSIHRLITLSVIAWLAPALYAECNYNFADQNNGWGWNPASNESCPPITASTGQCEDRGGYPWGWNPVTLKSCRLDETSLTPETDIFSADSAPLLAFGVQQSATLPAGTSTHFYKLKLSRPLALKIEGNINGDLDAAVGTVYKNSYTSSLKLREPKRCYPSGTYFLIVNNYPNTSDLAYNLSVSATDNQCVEQIAEVVNNEHPDGDYYVSWAITDDGTVFGMPLFNAILNAYDQNGELLWSNYDVDPVTAPDRLANGTTAVLSYKKLHLLDTAGEYLWTIDLPDADYPKTFKNVVANDDTIILYNDTEVVSFNSQDGSLRWRYSPRDYVSSVRVADNGKVLVRATEDPFAGVYFLEK